MTRHLPFFAAILLCACSCTQGGPTASSDRPNIVLIIVDDQAFGDFGFMGSSVVSTPNIDRLAEQGTIFPLAHATSSICKPTLMTLLTGYYPYQWNRMVEKRGASVWPADERTGVFNLSRLRQTEQQMVRDLPTLPRKLAERGYVSFEGGKYTHGGYTDAGFTAGMTGSVGEESRSADRVLAGGKGTRLGRETMRPLFEFLRERGPEPFLVWFAPMLPHVPFDAPKKYRDMYQGRGYPRRLLGYYANCTRLDDRVGELVAQLEANGQRDNTLIVLISDNGWQPRPDAYPLNVMGGPKGKGSLYEIGFRTPIVFNWAGHVPAGQVIDELASAVDIFPTIMDYAGAASTPTLPGVSLRAWIDGDAGELRPYLVGSTTFDRGSKGELVPESAFYLRDRNWYFIDRQKSGRTALYDMARDPKQDFDVSEENPELVARFRSDIQRWRNEMASGLPRPEAYRD